MVMRLYFVLGASPMLLLRAVFCHPWDSVVLLYADSKNMEGFKRKIKHCADALKKPMPLVQCSRIPSLDQHNSIAKFAAEINFDSMKISPETKQNDILFYSGTVLHLRCIATLLRFESILAYDNDKGFFTIGKQNHQFAEINLTIKTFFEINNVRMKKKRDGDSKEYVSLRSSDSAWKTRSKYLNKVEYINDMLHISWAKPPSSTQRKIIAKDCHLLKRIFGHYSIAHQNLPPALERLIRYEFISETMEEEE